MAKIRKREWATAKGEARTSWLVDYRDQAGERRFKQFDRKKDAEAWLTSAAHEVAQGTHTPASQSIPVQKAGEQFINRCRREQLEESTIAGYDQHLRLHINPLCGAVKLSSLTTPIVQGYRDHWLDTLSRPMAVKVLQTFSAVIDEARRKGQVAQNVCDPVSIGKKKREDQKLTSADIPSKANLKAFMQAAADADEPMAHPLAMVLVFAGLRASEIRGLPWFNVNLRGGTVKVDRRADNKNVIGNPKSASGYRTIPLPAMAVQALREWKLRCPNSADDLVFPSIAKKVMTHRYLTLNILEPVLIAAGLTEETGEKDEDGNAIVRGAWTLHDFRHACASLWIAQRVEPKRVQTWMGHHSITVTYDVYGHLFEELEQDAGVADAVASAILSA